MAEIETLPDEASAPSSPPPTPAPTDWRGQLPEDLRADKTLEKFKGTTWDEVGPELAKSVVSAQRMRNETLPAGVTADELHAYLTKKAEGPPASPDKYTVKPPTFPEETGITLDEGRLSRFLAIAHKHGLSNAQVQAFVDWEGQEQLTARDSTAVASNAEIEQAATELRQRWGSAYERNLGLARALVYEKFKASPRLLAAFERRGNDPDLVAGLAELAESSFERGEIRGDAIGGGQTVEEIEAELTRIHNDPKNAGNLGVVDRILALQTTLDRLKERAARK